MSEHEFNTRMKRKKVGDHILEGDVNRDLDNDLDVNDFVFPVVPTHTPRRKGCWATISKQPPFLANFLSTTFYDLKVTFGYIGESPKKFVNIYTGRMSILRINIVFFGPNMASSKLPLIF